MASRKNMTKEQLRARIVRRLERLMLNMDSIIRDKQHWNQTRTDAEPFDMGWEIAVRDAAKQELAAWNRNDMKAVSVMAARLSRLIRMPEAIE